MRRPISIFRQGLDGGIPEFIVSGDDNYFAPLVDLQEGRILYAASDGTAFAASPLVTRLMTVAFSGGASSAIMKMGYQQYLGACGATRAAGCIIGSVDNNQIVFSKLDSIKGKGSEIARIVVHPNSDPRWALSPDGERIAVVDDEPLLNEIRLLSIKDHTVKGLHPGMEGSGGWPTWWKADSTAGAQAQRTNGWPRRS
jgi:hypothetical protein